VEEHLYLEEGFRLGGARALREVWATSCFLLGSPRIEAPQVTHKLYALAAPFHHPNGGRGAGQSPYTLSLSVGAPAFRCGML
jgi:hypothetical protein